jgi:citrate lyase subunit beta/citryl-CoA lyase
MADKLEFIAPLFVPATRPERFFKAATSEADAIIVDLEDAVSPADKDAARRNLSAADELERPYIVRINGPGTPWHRDDIVAVRASKAVAILLPKTEDIASAREVKFATNGISLVGLVESAAGIQNSAALAATGLFTRFAFGPADFFADMSMEPNMSMTTAAMGQLALASRAAGLPKPLAGPCFKFGEDSQSILAECEADRMSGAGGKLCIHPSQPRIVLGCFRPSDTLLTWAKTVIKEAAGSGATSVKGEMVDAPVIARAHAILKQEQAIRCTLRDA